jgi:hypothetical protein
VLLVEGTQSVVQKNPARPVQQQPGEGETLLLLQGQFLVPPLLAIEHGQQMAKPDPLERAIYVSRWSSWLRPFGIRGSNHTWRPQQAKMPQGGH